MAVNKVEYKLASTTTGFAEAGDSVAIKTTNAKTIQKDVEEGCTEDLSNATQRYLNIRLEHSNTAEETDYEGDGEGGEEVLDENGDGEQDSKSGSGVSGGTIAGLVFGQAALAATTALHFPIMNAFTAPIVGMVDLQLAAVSLALTQSFDNEFNHRMSEAAAASEYVAELQEYEEIMNTDIETMTAALEELEATEGETEEAVEETESSEAADGAGELESLQAELEAAQAEGDEEKVAEIQAKIDAITSSLAEGVEEAEDPIEAILMNNESAHLAEDVSTDAAQFLHQGNQLGQLGAINAAQLLGSAVNSGFLAAEAWIGATPFIPFTISNAITGTVLSGVASGLFTTASALMTVKAVKEFKAAAKGQDIYSELTNMQDPLQQHDELVETLISKQEDSGESGSSEGSTTTTADAGTTTTTSGSSAGGTSSGSSTSSGGASGGSSSGGGSSSIS